VRELVAQLVVDVGVDSGAMQEVKSGVNVTERHIAPTGRMIVQILTIQHGGLVDLVDCELSLLTGQLQVARHVRLLLDAEQGLGSAKIAARLQVTRVSPLRVRDSCERRKKTMLAAQAIANLVKVFIFSSWVQEPDGPISYDFSRCSKLESPFRFPAFGSVYTN